MPMFRHSHIKEVIKLKQKLMNETSLCISRWSKTFPKITKKKKSYSDLGCIYFSCIITLIFVSAKNTLFWLSNESNSDIFLSPSWMSYGLCKTVIFVMTFSKYLRKKRDGKKFIQYIIINGSIFFSTKIFSLEKKWKKPTNGLYIIYNIKTM